MRNILVELLLIIAGIVIAVMVTITVGTSLVGVGSQFGSHVQTVFTSSTS